MDRKAVFYFVVFLCLLLGISLFFNFFNCTFSSHSKDKRKTHELNVMDQKLKVNKSKIQFEEANTEWIKERTKGDEYILYRYRRQDDATEANEDTEEPVTGGEGTTNAAPQVTVNATTTAAAGTTANAATTQQPETGGATTTVLTTNAANMTTAVEVVTTKVATDTTVQTTGAAEVTTRRVVEATTASAETTRKPDPEFPVTDPPVETTSAAAETSKATESATHVPTTTTLDPNDLEPGVVPGQICTTKLFKQVDGCCRTPTLIDEEDVQRCLPTGRRRKRQLPVLRALTDFLFPIITPRKKQQRRQQQRPQQQRPQAPPPRQLPGNQLIFTDETNANVEQVCLVDCVFRNFKWISDDDSLNMNMIMASIREMAPAWSSLLNVARKNCEPLIRAQDADALMQHPHGHLCQELPTKMLRCIKRTLAMNCPSPIRLGRDCLEVMDELKTCDIFAL